MSDTPQIPAPQGDQKKPWQTPRLTPYGTLAELTQGTGPVVSDNPLGSITSDRASKSGIERVDPDAVLRAVGTLPITTWSYLGEDTSVRHMGPMAQDFSAAFGLGGDDRRIRMVDAFGVALAAIQGLSTLAQQQARELEELRAAVERLNARRVH